MLLPIHTCGCLAMAGRDLLSAAYAAEIEQTDWNTVLEQTDGWHAGAGGVMYRSADSAHFRFYTYAAWEPADVSSAARQHTERLIQQARSGQVVFCWQMPSAQTSRQLDNYVVAPVTTASWLFTPGPRRSERLRMRK